MQSHVKIPEKVWEAFIEVRLNRFPEKVPGGFGTELGQVHYGSEKGFRKGLGGFGTEPGQVALV